MRNRFLLGLALLIASCGQPAVITAAEFGNLSNGMSYNEAEKTIGQPGEVISSSALGGVSTVMYSWKNDDGSNANAMFQNNKLITKAQMGLK